MQASAQVPNDAIHVIEGLVIFVLAARRYVASRVEGGAGVTTLLVTLVVLTLIKATPLIYAALGGVISERSGVINIGLEGMMAAGAFVAVGVSVATHSPMLGRARRRRCGRAASGICSRLRRRASRSIRSWPVPGST